MQRLENWYSQFKGYEKLTLKEAQEKLRKISSVSDKKEKEQLLNDVVLKTLHYVYKFIKNKYVEQIVNSSSSYDIEDLINSACEEWIKNIYNGKILEIENYNEILSKKFLFQTLIDMEDNCENDRIVCPRDYGHWSSQNNYNKFINLFLEYVKLKNKNENITNEIFFKCMCEGFNDPAKGIYSQERELLHNLRKELSNKYLEERNLGYELVSVEKNIEEIKMEIVSKEYSDELWNFRRSLYDTNVFDVIVRLYEILPKNSDGTLTVTKEELLLYKPTIMKMLNFENLVFNTQMTTDSDIGYVESKIDVLNSLNELNDREIDILFRRRAITGGDKETLEEVSKRFNVSPESIRQIEKRAAHKLQFYMDPNSR